MTELPESRKMVNPSLAPDPVTGTGTALSDAYEYCQRIARKHYENFPVASWLLPAAIRKPVTVIYTFARTADDIADEGNANQQQRLTELDQLADGLTAIENQQALENPLLIALAHTIQAHALPIQPFRDLLTAFRMDIDGQTFNSFDDLFNYCKYSANPVGILMLHLVDQASKENIQSSNAICSALQLINFLQDIEQDIKENSRLYIPLDEMKQHGVTMEEIANGINNEHTRALYNLQLQRAEKLLRTGSPLGKRLPGLFGLEIRMIIKGGERVLKKLKHKQGNLFARPRLNRWDGLWIAWRALINYRSSR